MSWISSKGQTFLKYYEEVFCCEGYSAEILSIYDLIYLFIAPFCCRINFALYFVTFHSYSFAFVTKYAKAFDTFWLLSTFLLSSTTLIRKITACKKKRNEEKQITISW